MIYESFTEDDEDVEDVSENTTLNLSISREEMQNALIEAWAEEERLEQEIKQLKQKQSGIKIFNNDQIGMTEQGYAAWVEKMKLNV